MSFRSAGGNLSIDMPTLGPVLIVRVLQVSHVDSMMPCGFELSPACCADPRPRSRNRACLPAVFRIGVNSSSAGGLGVQNCCNRAVREYTYPRRGLMAAAVLSSARYAPNHCVEQWSGKSQHHAHCRTVRRDKCFLVRNMTMSPGLQGADETVGK